MAKQYWLMKSEPETYSYADLVREKRGSWDGVRNFEARNNMRAMKVGDLALFYHSVKERDVVGVMKIVKEAYPDHTAEGGDWSMVDVEPVKPFTAPVNLTTLKADPNFADLLLIRRSRLSVVPVSAEHFRAILKLGKTKL
ncbi:MAG: EVE domain-containing protein [Polyangiaceae bacterium]|nr:EVE domain-containing protein [Myxococcales bacterium]MCB9584641.1 EVE domain-containing protein [Polyangiaceae bacterium]MCB9609078.1 EVE domain-containing protein [Polyangiaceae bacterium]